MFIEQFGAGWTGGEESGGGWWWWRENGGKRSWHEQVEKLRLYFGKRGIVWLKINDHLCWNVREFEKRLWRFMNAKVKSFIQHIDSGKNFFKQRNK